MAVNLNQRTTTSYAADIPWYYMYDPNSAEDITIVQNAHQAPASGVKVPFPCEYESMAIMY
jgi:hypothetical protein